MEEEKKKKSNIWEILKYLRVFRARVVIGIVLVIASKVFSVADPYVMKELIDVLVEKGSTAPLDFIALLIVIFFALRWGGNLLEGIKDYVFARVQTGIRKMVSLDVFEHLISLPAKFHASRATGRVSRKISRGTSSLETIFWFLSFNIIPTLIEIFFVIIIFIRLFPLSFTLAFAVFVVAYVSFTVYVTESRQKLLLEANKKDDKANGQSIDALMNYETVKYFGNEKYEYRRFGTFLADWAKVAVKATKSGANLNMGQGLIITAGLTAILVLAIGEYLKGQATIGDFVLVTTYLTRIAIPMSFLGFTYRTIKEGLANVDAMFRLLKVKNTILDKPYAEELEICEGNIEFRDVSFGYERSREVLSHINLKIPAKTRVALVGYSGSGKSTISKLLFRLYDVSSGSILIDGKDIRDIKQESLREHIGIVAQDTTLFNDTIFHNISYGKPGASKEEVERVAKMANIHDFIAKELPEGYGTIVGERGVKLSGGEKQRVAIARMLLKNPAVLVFDEATASLDTKSEKMIQEEIKRLSQGNITTIVIAHRLSTIVDFDKIVVLENGAIVEEGNHEELLRKKGVYYSLWQAQSKNGA
ncbi:MAG: ABC transporter related protein [Candidatus Moranbacteria bacterium GW2011_GWE1_49_15]|nr:MAG: ABC transporter related protein [Candidatus Moranbacteria bacterium GW2011_GWE1_49_15]